MDTLLSFDEIIEEYQQYHVQGVLTSKPYFFRTQLQLAILIFIVEDFQKNKIECIAFGKTAEKLSKIMLYIDNIYLITNAKAVVNKKYVKTKHVFKLELTNNTQITRLKTGEYIVNEKIYVSAERKRNKKGDTKKSLKSNQLSIKNWLIKKSPN